MSEKKKQAIEINMLLYQLEKYDAIDVDTLMHVWTCRTEVQPV